MLTNNQVRDVIGTEAFAQNGDKIGKIKQVYLDDVTNEPTFATVHTGFLGMKETFVPLKDAQFDGSHLTVGYAKDAVKDAPSIEPDGQVTPDEVRALYDHYGLTYSGPDSAEDRARAHGRHAEGDAVTTGTAGTSGTAGGIGDGRDAMTRSEEKLEVGTRTQETGRARLRKYIVTEEATMTVPVREERAVIEREPITDANRDQAYDGPDLTESEHEVVLHREVPTVSKETQPVERVRLSTQETSHDETVNESLRKEQIDIEDGTPNR